MVFPLGNPTESFEYGAVVAVMGGIIGFLALTQNQVGNFNIRPDIKEDGVLITSGIYKYIRHPMYTSVLTIMAGVVIMYPYGVEYILYSLLTLTLVIKLHYEESMWKCSSPEYIAYCRSSKKLIPLVY